MDLSKLLSSINMGVKIAQELRNNDGKPTPDLILFPLFDRRLSTWSSYKDGIFGHIQKCRDDLPSLRNRKEFHFLSGSNRLKGYLYSVSSPKGLVLCCHGLNGMADDNFSLCIDYFVRHGYSAIALDLTASGESQGLGISGLQQGPFDVLALENVIQGSPELSKLPLLLFGHSWGGYSVVASTYFYRTPVAVCELSGFSTPLDIMTSYPTDRFGSVASHSRPALEEALKRRVGDYHDLSAVEAIEKADNTDFLLIHGSEDTTVSLQSAALWRCFKDRNSSRVKTYLDLGKDHMGIWLTKNAVKANHEVLQKAKPFLKQYGKQVSRWPEEVAHSFFASIDKEKLNEFDEGLFDQIDSFCQEAIRKYEAK